MQKTLKFIVVLLLIISITSLFACSDLLTRFNTTTSTTQTITTINSSTTTTTTATSPPASTTPTNNEKLEVYFLDVGQGDSEIIRFGSSTMLIDAGTNASTSTLLADIKTLGLSKFDVVVATHPHEDHIGGLDAVINNYDIGTIYMPKVTTTTKTFTDVMMAIKNKNLTITSPVPGTKFTVGNAQCVIYAPNSQKYDDLNNYSIVIRVTFGSNSFLFTGDAQTLSEQEMLAKGFDLQADVLKVGHHGSDTSTSPDFLKAVSPKYAVIEVGAGNDYGHPHQITLDKLAVANVQVYRTDLNGIIEIISDGNDLNVISQKTASLKPNNTITTITTPKATSVSTTAAFTTTTSFTALPPSQTTTSANTLNLNILSVTSPVNAGSQATLTAKTLPGASCSINVYYKSGPSTASGLSTKTADVNGNVSWTWNVSSRTTPGSWKIVVDANLNGQAISQTTYFTVQ